MFIKIGTELEAKVTNFELTDGRKYKVLNVNNAFKGTVSVQVLSDEEEETWLDVDNNFHKPKLQIPEVDDEERKENRIDEQKKVADKVLLALRVLNPTAIVAGGAPRDWYMGEVANDIDVYIHYDLANPAHVAATLKAKLGGEWTTMGGDPKHAHHYEQLDKLIRVFQSKVDRETVQVIVMGEQTYKTVEQFPVSSSKIWYRTQNGLVTTNEFLREFIEKNIQVVRDDYYDEANVKGANRKKLYLNKMKERFPTNEYFYVKESDYKKFQEVEHKMRLQKNKAEFRKVIDKINNQKVPPINRNPWQHEIKPVHFNHNIPNGWVQANPNNFRQDVARGLVGDPVPVREVKPIEIEEAQNVLAEEEVFF